VIGALVDAIVQPMKGHALPLDQEIYSSHLTILFTAVVILSLTFFSRRFWCRSICPLGGLLALFTFRPVLRRRVLSSCNNCTLCETSCKTGAITDSGQSTLHRECIMCMSCKPVCPNNAIRFSPGGGELIEDKTPPPDVGRRGLMITAAASLAAVPALKLNTAEREQYQYLIRPPGALPEKEFNLRCIRCGECMKVCVRNALHPCFVEAGLTNMWTPRLVPRIGYCEYNCTLCGQVCPSGSIENLREEVKKKRVIGLAYIDRSRCIPWAKGRTCMVCEEMCPTPVKAIQFSRENVMLEGGKTVSVLKPYVVEKECIGCGICENKCPVEGDSAIIVTKVNPQREISSSNTQAPSTE